MANRSKPQMPSSLKRGDLKHSDKVAWETSQGETKETVKKKATKPVKIESHTLKKLSEK